MELSSSSCSLLAALFEMLGQISLYVTNTTIAKLYLTKKLSQIEGNGRKFSHKELSNSVISYIFEQCVASA